MAFCRKRNEAHMDQLKDFSLGFVDRLHSRVNDVRLRTRTRIAFSRNSYQEEGVSATEWYTWLSQFPQPTQSLVQKLETQYKMLPWRQRLNLASYTKNLATLWILEQVLDHRIPTAAQALEVGSQDFVRAPAISAFLEAQEINAQLTGLEIDAFPILRNLHSRFDLAQYYMRWLPQASFVADDFFEWDEACDLIFAFYPFVSPHPSLAWGLPKEFGDANRWVAGLEKTLSPGGHALVVHQGPWEQEEFDQALRLAIRRGANLERIHQQDVNCPFYPLPYPAIASLYRKL